MKKIHVPPGGLIPARLDVFLSEKTGISRSQIKKLVDSGDVLVEGRPARAGEKTRPGSVISIRAVTGPAQKKTLVPEPLPVKIVYSDDSIAVLDKPPSMVVYPCAGHAGGTLMNAAAFYFPQNRATIGAPLRPGVVHRLDKDTSGLLVIALEDRAYCALIEQFRTRAISRSYTALVYGAPRDEGKITLGIGRSGSDRKKMSTRTRRPKEALTSWKVIERFPKSALLQVFLGTGRTHQIRVHLSALGHPVLGDRLYGGKTSIELKGGQRLQVPRQMLHAHRLKLIHPATGNEMVFESPLPADMEEIISRLRAQ